MANNETVPPEHLLRGFSESVRRFPNNTALEVAGKAVTYGELSLSVDRLAATIAELPQTGFAGLLAARSETAYQAVLGILRSGNAYVPLNPAFPPERNQRMIEASGVNTIIVGEEGLDCLNCILQEMSRPLNLVLPDRAEADELRAAFPEHRFITKSQLSDAPVADLPARVMSADIAYLLFTSGSTGIPKGVAVSHHNVCSYLAYVGDRYKVNETDRFSQTFDLTFDLSVHDMFLCWNHGACLCCVPERSTMAPAKFIRDSRISMWFSVPSVATFLERLRLLKPGAFPTIRQSLFCGEPLLASSAKAWQAAAPDSVVENLYGPTEATIAISHYTWSGDSEDQEFPNGVVPIGDLFPSQSHRVINSDGICVDAGERGELCLGGSQVTNGYLNNEAKTTEQFVQLPGENGTWYRTGDLVCEDDSGCLYYLGRIDNQIQVLGHRVELQEVEHALREIGNDTAVALGWPPRQSSAECIYAVFAADQELDTPTVMEHCKNNLPDYMVPRAIFTVARIPLNANGKVDRNALNDQLQGLLDE